MKKELSTLSERERAERHKSICNEYSAMVSRYPDCRPHRIMRVVAEKYEMTVPGVRCIIQKYGLYQGVK